MDRSPTLAAPVAVRAETIDASPSRTRWVAIAAICLLCFGAAMRVRQYAARTSFWADEAFVVMNLRDLSAMQLMGKLKFDQAAPPVFLWSLKGMSQLTGANEYSLRLIPLLLSVAGLGAFGLLAWRLMPPPAALLAIGLFALDRRLVEYAADVKQYSGDVTIAALLLLIAFWRPHEEPAKRLMRTAIAAAIAVWCSHPVAIVFGGISIVLSLAALRRDPEQSWTVFRANGLFALSFVRLYGLSIHRQHTQFLYLFWKQSFPDVHHPLLFPVWFWHQFFDLLQAPYRWAGAVFILLTAIAIVRTASVKQWTLVGVLIAPLALTVIAAIAQQYPFNASRLTLFLMPELYLLVGLGATALWTFLPPAGRIAWWVLPAALIGTGLAGGISRMARPVYKSSIRPMVEYAQARSQPGDALLLIGEPPSVEEAGQAFNGRHVEALCYWDPPPGRVYSNLPTLKASNDRRFWVFVAFTPGHTNAIQPLIRQIRAIATERDHLVDPHGGAVFLFER